MTDTSAPAADAPVTNKKQLLQRLKELGRRVLWGTANGILMILTGIAESYLKFFDGIKSWTAVAILASFVGAGGGGMWLVSVPKRNATIADLNHTINVKVAENERVEREIVDLQAQLSTAKEVIQRQSSAMLGHEEPKEIIAPIKRASARKPVLRKQPESKGFWEGITGALP